MTAEDEYLKAFGDLGGSDHDWGAFAINPSPSDSTQVHLKEVIPPLINVVSWDLEHRIPFGCFFSKTFSKIHSHSFGISPCLTYKCGLFSRIRLRMGHVGVRMDARVGASEILQRGNLDPLTPPPPI